MNHVVFSEDKFDLGGTHVMSHEIGLRDKEPVYIKQFRIPETHRFVILEFCKIGSSWGLSVLVRVISTLLFSAYLKGRVVCGQYSIFEW